MVLTIVSFIVVLGVLVFFHELGHYWMARRSGIVVEEFGMGYPPRLAKLFTYDGTDFTLNALPLGGFARMKGEDAGDMSPGSFNAASIGGRAATLVAGPFMNALLAVILFAASFAAGFPGADRASAADSRSPRFRVVWHSGCRRAIFCSPTTANPSRWRCSRTHALPFTRRQAPQAVRRAPWWSAAAAR